MQKNKNQKLVIALIIATIIVAVLLFMNTGAPQRDLQEKPLAKPPVESTTSE